MKQKYYRSLLRFALSIVLFITGTSQVANAYLVTELQATYSNGQVFLTWKNPSFTNLQYNVYRSTSPFLSAADLNTSTYIGFVRDNSGKNVRKSTLYGQNFYFKTSSSGNPLASDRGLYVATCTNASNYYYAVMVVTLSNNIEDKSSISAANSLAIPVNETVADPQPVLQHQATENDGTLRYEYALWGNNQETPHFPAFNNAGSYAHNFTVFKSGNSTNKSIYVLFKDDNPFSTAGIKLCTDCNVLKIDDRLPNGVDSYWSGWNENYNMYSTTNPVPTTGVVRMFTQYRLKETLEWVRKSISADSNRVYLTGVSHNGYGALLTSQMWPSQVTAVWVKNPPTVIKPINNSAREEQWSDNAENPNSDFLDPNTGIPIPLWQLFDIGHMYIVNAPRSIPFMGGINGKQDVTVGWVQKYYWYDTVNIARHGGAWYWDQRKHNNTGSTFTDLETTVNYERFTMARSYPAFSYCSINQNPGDGTPSNGDPIGALNGYLDWNDQSIVDNNTNYDITCFVKDMYAGGVLMANQYDSCTTDITFRRLQQFKPFVGQVITWSVRKNGGDVVQSGTTLYAGGPITLYGVKIYRAGSNISMTVPGCTITYYADSDHDGFGSSTDAGTIYCTAPNGLVTNNSDCNDNNVAINPLAQEVCDANDIDEDCDGMADDADASSLGKSIYYADADLDGFGAVMATGTLFCNPPAGYVTIKTDCNDANAAIHPNAQEVCDINLIDENCNGLSDDADPGASGKTIYFADADQDGFGAANTSGTAFCTQPPLTVTGNTDCNDNDAGVNPAATELCAENGVDEDCDGLLDHGDPSAAGASLYFVDTDADGYGDASDAGTSYCTPPSGVVSNATDCNDADASVNPAGIEICDPNNTDEDCNGVADNGDPLATGKSSYYTDADGDGFGAVNSTATAYCSAPANFASNNTDCNDLNSAVNPASQEVCDINNLDEDCDGLSDDDDNSASGQALYYADADQDQYGSSADPGTVYCNPPAGFVNNNTDCNESDANIHPAAQEVCDVNDLDENCNGLSDDADPSSTGKIPYYPDADLDGFGAAGAVATAFCTAPIGYAAVNTDCNDAAFSINPAAPDMCDGIDNNCNGTIDENAITVNVTPIGPLTGCKSDLVTLTATGTNITSYKWYKGTNPNSVSGQTNSTYTLLYDNTTVKAVVSNSFGCSATSNIVTMTGVLQPSSVITVQNNGNLNLCTGQVSLTATGGTNFIWQWYRNEVLINGATNVNYIVTSNGTYTVKVTNLTGCFKISNPVTVFGQATYYVDADLDGFGDAAATASSSCTPIQGMVTNNIDCNDGNAGINPSSQEICDINDVDEDCDGLNDDADNSATGKLIYYTDTDGDGYGAAYPAGTAYCNPPAGLVQNSGDCNDAANAINPGNAEVCDPNETDENCNGLTDDADVNAIGKIIYYADADQDEYGDINDAGTAWCNAPSGSVTTNNDCNDTDGTVNPAASEICDANSIDEDCNGLADNEDPAATGKLIYYADADLDGYGAITDAGVALCHPSANMSVDNSDCNDMNNAVHPGAIEICDANETDEDCNGLNDDNDAIAIGKLIYYSDADNDGYGNLLDAGIQYCHPPSGVALNNTDCNDADLSINPSATELCDANDVDEDCNGLSDDTDPNAIGQVVYYADADNDGHGDIADQGTAFCNQPAMMATSNDDCNDNDGLINPSAIEICDANTVDEDCNGLADDNDVAASGKSLFFADADQDGYGDVADAGTAACLPPALLVTNNTDCNDADLLINPAAVEVCSAFNIDENCNGLTDNADPAAMGASLYYADIDLDGFGDVNDPGTPYCDPVVGVVSNNTDCNDADNTINPSSTELCDANDVDEDCNGLSDDTDPNAIGQVSYYLDVDNDGHGDITDQGTSFCNQPATMVTSNDDCNDNDGLINPSAAEICDANMVDEDCNGLADDNDVAASGKTLFYTDADQDGYGDVADAGTAACIPPALLVNNNADCNDADLLINPAAVEVCSAFNIDENCNGLTDNADPAAMGASLYYADLDLDGFGDVNDPGTPYCDPVAGVVSNNTDCNDANLSINPSATELCDANDVDEDCNGLADDTDPNAIGQTIYYADADNDGHGDITDQGTSFCNQPATMVTSNDDCNDNDGLINPSATEICDANTVDEDCNGLSDDNDVAASGKTLFFADADQDGYGDVTDTGNSFCHLPSGSVADHSDCNDSNAGINPAASEICDLNETDEDCDGLIDENDPSANSSLTYYTDADNDGFGSMSSNGVLSCSQPVGMVLNNSDCNDLNASINPAASEICDANQVDENCNGLADDNDPSTSDKAWYYTDADIDGYGSPADPGTLYCIAPLGFSSNNSDCNDLSASVHPLAPEFCDPNDVDEDCDGLADNADPSAIGKITYYADQDNDTYGAATDPGIGYCTPPPAGVVTNNTDCNDANAAIRPDAVEICDGIDNNCNGIADENLTVSNPMPSPVITPASSTSFCFDQSITLTATDGFNQYSWSNGKTGLSITANTAGNITVTVKDNNNCYGTSAPLLLTLWEPEDPLVSCSGPSTYCLETPSVLSTISGYNYQWKKGSTVVSNATNQTYVPTSSSTAYKVTITDAHGCSKTSEGFPITVNNASIPIITVSGGTSICEGDTSILTASAGFNAYQWSTGATATNIVVTQSGNYAVTITDQNGCTAASLPKTITVNPLPQPVITASGPTSFCDGGSVVLDAGAGYSSYNWSNGKLTQTSSITTSGIFSVTVTNSNNCTATSAPVTVTEWIPEVPTITTSTGATTFCANTGVYLNTISGVSYQWQKTSVDISGATAQSYLPTSGGSYKVKVTDVNGCEKTSATLTITILNNPVPVITGTTTICEGSTTTLSCGSYSSYSWSTGSTSSTITPSTAGDYTVTVTDANDCIGTSAPKTTTIVPLPVPVITAQSATEFCDGGSVVLDAGSGYTSYNWSNVKTTQTNTITASGIYTVTVTNSNGCMGTSAPVTVDEWIPPTPVISSSSGTSTFCGNAGIYLTTIGGYSYKWQKSGIDISGATQQNYIPASGGNYKVIITDVHGCSKTSATYAVTLLSNPVPVITGPSTICAGSSVTLSCGTFVGYNWSNGSTAATINTNVSDNYTVTVTDGNGCQGTSAVKTTTVVPLPVPVITAQGPTSFCDGGSVTLDAGAGYTSYNWSNGKTTQTNAITASGTLTVTVTNSNGCIGTSAPVTVEEWIPPTPVISSSSGASTFCANAGVYLTTIGGYSYQWQKSSANIAGATQQNYYPTSGGNYKVIITDVNGCSKTSGTYTITINANPVPVISGSSTICQGSSVSLTCGTFTSYSWSTGATTASINVSTAGSYTVTVTDGNGCPGTSAPKVTSVVALPVPVITAQGPLQFCDGGSVVLDAGAGYSTYNWSNVKTTQTNTITASATITVTVTNSNGCAGTSAPVTVDEWIPPTPVVTIVGPSTYCINAGTYLTTLAGATTYQWIKGTADQAGATNQNFTPTSSGTYKVRITESHGCSKTSSGVTVTVNNAPTATISISGSANICSGQTKTITANTGTGFTYQWKRDGNNLSGATASSYVAGIAGSYTCVVKNANLCSTTSNTIVITSNCKGEEAITANAAMVTWQVYPNPTSNDLHIRMTFSDIQEGNYEMEIRNMVGSVVWRNKSTFIDYTIAEDLLLERTLSAGSYFVIIHTNNQVYKSQFIITRN